MPAPLEEQLTGAIEQRILNSSLLDYTLQRFQAGLGIDVVGLASDRGFALTRFVSQVQIKDRGNREPDSH